jgi:uncharacterized protein YbjT (DUF2867 family)
MTSTSTILVLGGTGKTGRRIAGLVAAAGATARTAARSGADVRFDWDDPATHGPALAGVDTVYLVPPALRLDHAADVLAFVDRAVAAGVRAITFLSARGVEHAPPEVALRTIELGLQARDDVAVTILRPSWFMQNLDEGFMQPGLAADGVIALPAGDGAEAFVDARDIADVAAAALLDPAAHAGQAYEITGPQALTHHEVARIVGDALGREVTYVDVAPDAWIAGAAAAGLPADYAAMLAGLFAVIADGHGARPGDAVQRVTGHAPRSLADFAREAAAAGAWAVPATV